MGELIQIRTKDGSSYYYSEKDRQKLLAFADVVNNTKSDIKISVKKVDEPYVPSNIKLDDQDLRYFNLQQIFNIHKQDVGRPSKYVIDKIAKECFFNEDYCDFVCDTAVELTTVESTAAIGKEIADTIIPSVQMMLERHSRYITKCFEEYKKKVEGDIEYAEPDPSTCSSSSPNSVHSINLV